YITIIRHDGCTAVRSVARRIMAISGYTGQFTIMSSGGGTILKLSAINSHLIFAVYSGSFIHSQFILSLRQYNRSQMIKITEKPIDVQKVIDTASSLGAGAVNVFVGTVRNTAHGKNVLWL